MKNSSLVLLIPLSLGLSLGSCKKEEHNRPPQNYPPIAEAGPHQSIVLPTNSVTLDGFGRDAEGPIVQYQWTKISGPSVYTIADSLNAVTKVTDLQEGGYVFRLKVVDGGGLGATDFVSISVQGATVDPCYGCWDY